MSPEMLRPASSEARKTTYILGSEKNNVALQAWLPFKYTPLFLLPFATLKHCLALHQERFNLLISFS